MSIEIKYCRCRVSRASGGVPNVKFMVEHPDGNFCQGTACGAESVPMQNNSYREMSSFQAKVVRQSDCCFTSGERRRRHTCPRELTAEQAKTLLISNVLFD
jgi:hypothetical protein